ncbi:MAG: stage III sporulation protein AD [Ruminococcus sp.]|nr:stage III sporulation protein AD [Ruminococcus sp.]
MNIAAICALAVVAVVVIALLRPKNAETALMLGIAASVLVLLTVISQASAVIGTVNSIVAAAQIKTEYLAILLKAVGVCLITEFTVNTCRDAGSQALAGNVSLAGKILVTIIALPLYTDILNTVLQMIPR